MDLLKQQTNLIEKLVKANSKYSGNEDLLEDFCMETYQKSYFILQSVEDTDILEKYLKKVVSSAIIDVLKNTGRIVRNTGGYSNIKEISSPLAKNIQRIEKEEIKEEAEEEIKIQETVEPENTSYIEEVQELSDKTKPQTYKNQIHDISIDLADIKDPKESIEEQIIRKDILENIVSLVKQINANKPEELFLKLFYSRYFLQMKQREIAQETGLSQSEISKRLVHLSRLIKEKLYQ